MSNSVDVKEESASKIHRFIVSSDAESGFKIIDKRDESESDSDGSIIILDSTESPNLVKLKAEASSDNDESNYEVIDKREESESDTEASIIMLTGTTSPNLAKLKEAFSDNDESNFEVIEKRNESENDSEGSIIILTGTTSPNLAKLKEAFSDNDESNFEVIEKRNESENDSERSIIMLTGITSPNLEKLKEASSDKDELNFEVIEKRDESESDFEGSIIMLTGTTSPNLTKLKEQETEGRNKCAGNSDSEDSDSFVVVPIQEKAQFLHSQPHESFHTLRSLSENLQNRSDFNQLSEVKSGNADTDSNDSFCECKFRDQFSSDDEKSYSSNDAENTNNEEEETDDFGRIKIIAERKVSQLKKTCDQVIENVNYRSENEIAGDTVQEGIDHITLVDDNKIKRKYELTSESTKNETVTTSDSGTASPAHEIKIGGIMEEGNISNELHTINLKPENLIEEDMVKDNREDATEVINDEEYKKESNLYVENPKNEVTTNWQELGKDAIANVEAIEILAIDNTNRSAKCEFIDECEQAFSIYATPHQALKDIGTISDCAADAVTFGSKIETVTLDEESYILNELLPIKLKPVEKTKKARDGIPSLESAITNGCAAFCKTKIETIATDEENNLINEFHTINLQPEDPTIKVVNTKRDDATEVSYVEENKEEPTQFVGCEINGVATHCPELPHDSISEALEAANEYQEATRTSDRTTVCENKIQTIAACGESNIIKELLSINLKPEDPTKEGMISNKSNVSHKVVIYDEENESIMEDITVLADLDCKCEKVISMDTNQVTKTIAVSGEGNTINELLTTIKLKPENPTTEKATDMFFDDEKNIVTTNNQEFLNAREEVTNMNTQIKQFTSYVGKEFAVDEESNIVNEITTIKLKPEDPIKDAIAMESIPFVAGENHGVTTDCQESEVDSIVGTINVLFDSSNISSKCTFTNEYEKAISMDTKPSQVISTVGEEHVATSDCKNTIEAVDGECNLRNEQFIIYNEASGKALTSSNCINTTKRKIPISSVHLTDCQCSSCVSRVSHKKEHKNKRDLCRNVAIFILFCIPLRPCMKIVWFIYQLLNPLQFLMPVISYWEECYWLKLLVFCVLITRNLRNWKLVFYLWFVCFLLIQLLKLIAAICNVDNGQEL